MIAQAGNPSKLTTRHQLLQKDMQEVGDNISSMIRFTWCKDYTKDTRIVNACDYSMRIHVTTYTLPFTNELIHNSIHTP